jgi:hypothetical protein
MATRKTRALSIKAKINPYDTTPIASHEFVRSVTQEKSLNARTIVQT